jgi:hypothetical protein
MPTIIKSKRGQVAALSRSRLPTDPELIEARRTLAAENLAKYVANVIAKAPPLTAEQRDRIASILHGGAA